ncbi:reverse transcriptase domain-containing protein [Tanacetum coccineum]|uniref:Reverse transcriptase domain-containing protein n=1 Tax=Tanacetum coccineum TaxID=301880 RepID=A0ABQ4Z047_9ASTR
METQAIDDQDHLVNYDNDNENDDLGYRSEEYFDEAHEEDENNHSNGNVVKRGITRLYKFHMEYGKPDGIRLSVTFNALNRILGKHIALFLSFLGDMVREDIGLKILSWKKVDSEARDKLWDEIMKKTKDKIKEGTLMVDHGTDAMTIVLGKEKGGYARGVGSGVTYKRYFDLPRSRQASNERILLLQSQLDNERRERQEKELLIQNLSNKMSQTEGMVTKLKNHSADEEGGTTVVGCKNDASIQKSNGLATLEKEMETRAIKCKLWHLKKSTIIALGTIYKTNGKQMLHNKELLKDCYKVSIDTSLVDAACIPDVGNNGFKTVMDAVGGFFAWPKDLVVFDPKDEVPEFVIKFLKMIQVRLYATIQNIRTDNGTEFVNQTLRAYYKERQKPDLSHLQVFGALCYPTNNSKDLGKLKPKADIRIFIGYAPAKKALYQDGQDLQNLEGFAAALAVLITGASQSRQHGKSEPDLTSHLPQSLFDVGSGRISIVIVITF